MDNTQETQAPATTEAPATGKRKYVRRTPEERKADLLAKIDRIDAEASVSPDVRTARRAVTSLENAAEKVTDASIKELLASFAADLSDELASL
jgi:hypothetical protein